jgi:hypothetical protein
VGKAYGGDDDFGAHISLSLLSLSKNKKKKKEKKVVGVYVNLYTKADGARALRSTNVAFVSPF